MRDKSLDAIDSGDVGLMAYRYLQVREGFRAARNEGLIYCGLFALNSWSCAVSFKEAINENKDSISAGKIAGYLAIGAFAVCMISLAVVMISIDSGNAWRYYKTEHELKAALLANTTPQVLSRIDSLVYQKSGVHNGGGQSRAHNIPPLIAVLGELNIEVEGLRELQYRDEN